VAEEPVDHRRADPEAASVLRRYLDGDRLASMPRAGRKRQIVLEYIVTTFEPGRRYPEEEVNATLRAFHDDVPALRRYLVEAGLLDRAGGEYWRSGGWVEGS
jgi:hypothetical protein